MADEKGFEEEFGKVKSCEKIETDSVFGSQESAKEVINPSLLYFFLYNEVNEGKVKDRKRTKQDEEWSFRMKCAQDWFIKCSPVNKFLFLEILCHSTSECLVIENIVRYIASVLCKDVLESISNSSTYSDYNKTSINDSFGLNIEDLKEAMKNCLFWFVSLNPQYQIRVILRLLRLGSGSLVYHVYKMTNKIKKERQAASLFLFPEYTSKLDETERISKRFKANSNTLVSKKSLDTNTTESENSSISDFKCQKLHQLARREAELIKYMKLNGIYNDDYKVPKKEKLRETVDYLQILPLSVNRRIMSFIDDKSLPEYKKVGKYWRKMIDELINEKSGRKAINAKIHKIIEIKSDKKGKRGEVDEDENFDFTIFERVELINKTPENRVVPFHTSKIYETIFKKNCNVNQIYVPAYSEQCFAFDKLTGLAACSTQNNDIHFYSSRTKCRSHHYLYGFDAIITCLAFHTDGIHMLIGCSDGSITAKNITTCMTTATFSGHEKSIISIATSSSNLLSGSTDNTIKYHQLWSGVCLFCVNLSQSLNISSMLLIKEKSPLATAGGMEGIVVVVGIDAKKILRNVKLHNGEITHMGYEKNILVTGSRGGKIRVWDMTDLDKTKKSMKLFYNIKVESAVCSLVIHNDQIFCGCENGTIKVISLASGNIFKTMKISYQTPILGLAVTEDKVTMKLIIWHEGVIEMRTFSLPKSSRNKKSIEENNQERKQKAPNETRKNKISQVALADYKRNSQGLIEISHNVYDGKSFLEDKMFLGEPCTSFTRKKPRENYRKPETDVFTQVLNDRLSAAGHDFTVESFYKFENLTCNKK